MKPDEPDSVVRSIPATLEHLADRWARGAFLQEQAEKQLAGIFYSIEPGQDCRGRDGWTVRVCRRGRWEYAGWYRSKHNAVDSRDKNARESLRLHARGTPRRPQSPW